MRLRNGLSGIERVPKWCCWILMSRLCPWSREVETWHIGCDRLVLNLNLGPVYVVDRAQCESWLQFGPTYVIFFSIFQECEPKIVNVGTIYYTMLMLRWEKHLAEVGIITFQFVYETSCYAYQLGNKRTLRSEVETVILGNVMTDKEIVLPLSTTITRLRTADITMYLQKASAVFGSNGFALTELLTETHSVMCFGQAVQG